RLACFASGLLRLIPIVSAYSYDPVALVDPARIAPGNLLRSCAERAATGHSAQQGCRRDVRIRELRDSTPGLRHSPRLTERRQEPFHCQRTRLAECHLTPTA